MKLLPAHGKRRPVSNEEFQEALANQKNRYVLEKIKHWFVHQLSRDDLESCGQAALWRTLQYHREGRGTKFTSSLAQYCKYECLNWLRKLNRQRINEEEIDGDFEVDYGDHAERSVLVKECLDFLTPSERRLIEQYYLERRTLGEIGRLNHLSKPSVAKYIRRALKKIRESVYRT